MRLSVGAARFVGSNLRWPLCLSCHFSVRMASSHQNRGSQSKEGERFDSALFICASAYRHPVSDSASPVKNAKSDNTKTAHIT